MVIGKTNTRIHGQYWHRRKKYLKDFPVTIRCVVYFNDLGMLILHDKQINLYVL